MPPRTLANRYLKSIFRNRFRLADPSTIIRQQTMEASMSHFQFIHLGGYGRSPRKGQPIWSCVAGITAEGARVPSASRHIRYRGEPKILHGASPLEAGRLATERADRAYDHGRRLRRLRRDGIALLAGVVSY